MQPLLIFGHCDWSGAQAFHDMVGIVTFALQDAGKRIIRFLDLAYDD